MNYDSLTSLCTAAGLVWLQTFTISLSLQEAFGSFSLNSEMSSFPGNWSSENNMGIRLIGMYR